ncbi:MAG: glycosyltransferase family 1 protein [Verrucomicrobia bacterium]|jgi:1,2-diacylglycerol 3-alpha-glucosyltransferase|nr:glycosyltransferase family 1 protein [Verrucomicrobiota bacterium]MBT7066534.1 glycosyltransferase family 1 protein [Verrucomicrobiota bacterium]MBT7700051.1 glycosyltransferase family 1 protein [Verrucomicrobiota bacterium]
MHIAVLFARFGAYHVARLEAAGKRAAAEGGRVTGIEVSRTGTLYAWDPVEGGVDFTRATLFEGRDYQSITSAEMRRAVHTTLSDLAPDVVALPGWIAGEALAGLHWAAQHGLPSVLLSESARIDATRRPVAEAIKRRLVSRFGAGLVGGPTHVSYLAELGMPAERVALGYDTVDNAHFARGADAARADADARRQALGLPSRYFLSSCRFIPKKNLSGLLNAFARYRQLATDAPWDLVLCGDGDLRPGLEAEATDLGLRAAVHFPGFAGYGDLPAIYGLAQTFIQSSTVEQWGLVVNEAAAAGLPLLVSEPSGCAATLVENGRNGFIFDPHNVDELAALMTRMAGGQMNLAAMGTTSRDVVAPWDAARFGEGLMQAAAIAAARPVPRLTPMDRLLLQRLMRK